MRWRERRLKLRLNLGLDLRLVLGLRSGVRGLGGGYRTTAASRVRECHIEPSIALWGLGPRSDRVLRVCARGSDGGGPGWTTRGGARGPKVVFRVGIRFIFIGSVSTFAVHDGRRAAETTPVKNELAAWRRNTYYLVLPCEMKRSIRTSCSVGAHTHVVVPFDPGFELRQTEMDLDAKDDGPVHLAIPPRLWFCAATERRQICADDAERPVILCG